MLTHALLVFASVVGLATAQIDLSSVPPDTRDSWCQDQQLSCPLICLQLPGANGSPISNTCNSTTLDYSCVCSNNQSPNASEYTQTIPYFICTQTNIDCVNNCNGLSTCQSACQQDHPCGAQHPKKVNVTSTASAGASMTSSSAATGTGATVVYNGFGSSATTPASSSGNSGNSGSAAAHAMMLEIGQVYGIFAVVGGMLGGFFMLL